MNLDFKFFADNTGLLAGQLFQNSPNRLFNILSEVTGLMNEHNVETIGDLFHKTSVQPTSSSVSNVADYLKTSTLSTVGVGIFISVVILVLKYTPLLACLYSLTRRPQTAAPPVPSMWVCHG